jgi:predicted metal-dependent hydrolase
MNNLGRAYRLSLVADQSYDLKLNEGRFCLNRTLIDQNGSNAAKKAFEGFYSEKGRQWIGDRVTFFAPTVGVKPTSVTVKDLGYRWASCTPNNGLAFHWKTMMAPPKIIDYVVVHELCHIYHRNHSDAFWNEIDKVMPDYRERKTWLKQHGAELDL